MKKQTPTQEQRTERMEKLDKAIEVTGGVGLLAKSVGVPNANSISNWRKRAWVPNPWMRLIEVEVLRGTAKKEVAQA